MKKILLCSVFLFFATALFAQQTEEQFKPVTNFVIDLNYGFAGDNAYTVGVNFGASHYFTKNLYSTLTVGHLNMSSSGYGYSMKANYIPIQLGFGCSLGTGVSIDPHIIASLNCGLKGAGTGLGIKIGAGLNFYGFELFGRYNLGRDNSDGYYEIGFRTK